MSGRDDADLLRFDDAARRLDTLDGATRIAAYGRHFRILDDIDAECARRPRIAPRDRIVPCRAAAPLQGRTEHGIAQLRRDIERRTEILCRFRRQPLIIDAGKAVCVHMPLENLNVVDRVRQHHHATRRVHDVVIELVRERLPELYRQLVDRLRLFPEIVRPDDRRVATGVAATEPALLDDHNIPEPVLLGEIVGRAEPMPAATDDHRVVGCLGLGRTPLRRPARVPAKRLARQREE